MSFIIESCVKVHCVLQRIFVSPHKCLRSTNCTRLVLGQLSNRKTLFWKYLKINDWILICFSIYKLITLFRDWRYDQDFEQLAYYCLSGATHGITLSMYVTLTKHDALIVYTFNQLLKVATSTGNLTSGSNSKQ